ncbi:MAG: energy transducer TonB [Acidobacteriota bacterium]|nr:energy transducer TonB [Acidobacteriota bacterium]
MPTDTSGETGERPAFPPVRSNESEYLDWGPAESPVAIRMHLDAVDGIARDVIEGIGMSPRSEVEVGGLLLGRVVSTDRHLVWIERYQRISCNHSFGPHFILDPSDTSALEQAATSIFNTREMAVVGLYRSHTRPGLQLEESDFDLIRRYFNDPSDLVLLVKPGNANNLFGQFYRFDVAGGAQPVGDRFPFRGNVVTPDTARTVVGNAGSSPPFLIPVVSIPPASIPMDKPRRLVPDFAPSPVEPDPAVAEGWKRPEESAERSAGGLKKWMLLAAAMLLVGGIIWFLLQPGRSGTASGSASQQPAVTDTVRPLGLYVDPMAQTWRVLWNPNATALRDARGVHLFVREGDDQNRIELSPHDLGAGSYEYRPIGNDVTFRLEVTDKAGNVSAESFRLVRATGAAPVPSGAPPPVPVSPLRAAPAPAEIRNRQPKPIYRAPPIVAAGIRPRIKGPIPIDVKVQIDAKGRVVTASPITKIHNGLEEYLATRALQAAREWKFEPARQNGKPVPGTQTIHFLFTR